MAIRRVETFVSDEFPDRRITMLTDTKGKEPTIYRGVAIVGNGQQAGQIKFSIVAESLTEALNNYEDAKKAVIAQMNRPKIAVPNGRIRMN